MKEVLKILEQERIKETDRRSKERMKIIHEIQQADFLSPQEKEVYSTIVSEWDIVRRVVETMKTRKVRTIKAFRNRLLREIGVAPAILYSFSFLFTTPREYWNTIKKENS